MLNSLRNMVSNTFYAPSVKSAGAASASSASGYNPFENPFVQPQNAKSSYGINRPVKGGYFAGYYNGKPNIVGRKLFIEA